MEESSSFLSNNHRKAAASLFALAFHHSQIHQTVDSKFPPLSEDYYDFLCPIFRFLGVDEEAWHSLKETAGSYSQIRDHLGYLLKLLSEESDVTPSEALNKEAALTKAVDASALGMNNAAADSPSGVNGQKTKAQEDSSEVVESSALLPLEKAPSIELVVATFEQPLEEANLISYQRKITVLYTLVAACVADHVETDKKDCQLRQGYDARHRLGLRLLAVWLGVKWNEMEAMEGMVAYTLMNSMSKEGDKEGENVGSETNWDKWKRGSIIGAAAVTGGTVMAITGGLAAPAIAHGLGALAPTLGGIAPAIGGGFAAAATATGSVVGSAAVAASFGAAGAGLTGSKMANRIGNLEEFQLKEIGGTGQGHLAVTICISGLAFEEKDFVKPWEGLNDNMERYVLQYESKHLIALSTAIQDWLTSKIVTELMKEGAMMTVLSSLVASLAWPATLVTTFDIIDNKWTVAVDRSDKAGKVLAEVLLSGLQGCRPVTLVGFSLGARVIFKCLQFLAESNGAGIVERVVFLGAPIPIKDENWEAARKMVAGRFVNVYSTNDWTLGVAFRASLLSQGLAGIQPVDIPGVENVDVTKLIDGHSCYLSKAQKILEQLELENCCAVITSGLKNPKEGKTNPK